MYFKKEKKNENLYEFLYFIHVVENDCPVNGNSLLWDLISDKKEVKSEAF